MKIFSVVIMFLIFLSILTAGISDTETAQPSDSAPAPVSDNAEGGNEEVNTPEARRARRRKAKREYESDTEEESPESEETETDDLWSLWQINISCPKQSQKSLLLRWIKYFWIYSTRFIFWIQIMTHIYQNLSQLDKIDWINWYLNNCDQNVLQTDNCFNVSKIFFSNKYIRICHLTVVKFYKSLKSDSKRWLKPPTYNCQSQKGRQ